MRKVVLIIFLFSTSFFGYSTGDSSLGWLVRKNGYPFEEHEVVTEDGYILALHRIPHGRNDTGGSRKPVLLQHGLMGSSACWVVSRPDKGLGYLLADEGYDVWMANSRGNPYSKKHQSLNPDNEPDAQNFWDFSFHEMGIYDLPACIDYILNITGHRRLHYVGHSQGSASFFVLTSTKTEYNEKITHMSALAPIAFLGHTRGSANYLMQMSSALKFFSRYSGIHQFSGDVWLVKTMQKYICREYKFAGPICDNVLFLVAGFDSQQLNVSLMHTISEYLPAGTSVKQLTHFAQLVENKGENFRPFDYGSEINFDIYSQEEPPEYNLSQISTPIALFYAKNDWLSGVPDVLKLNSKIPNSSCTLVPYPNFNHVDFMWAVDVCSLLYNDLINEMKKY